MMERTARWLDERLGGDEAVEEKVTHIFPESWTFLFGEIALYCFMILVLTGTFLAFFFDASLAETTYHGTYQPLVGQKMSAAYESVIALSWDVRAGLLIRQIHHWAALVFVAAIVVHLMRIFLTGAFRKPRELNWTIGVTLLILAIAEGFFGYSLVDDLLSGVGLRIGYSIIESIPVVGQWLAVGLFGGTFPGDEIINRLFALHIYVLPLIMGGLIALHLAMIFRQEHTQFPGEGRTEDNIVGLKTWPTYAAMSVGLFLLVFAVLAGLGGLVQINPVWFWGPYDPYLVTIGAQPDWYMGWLEGALRIFPPWEIRGDTYMIPNQFFPAIFLPLTTFAVLYAYPWIERRITGDHRSHQLLDRARFRPVRTSFAWAALSFYAMLTIAGSQDILAFQLNVSITGLVWFLRIATVVVPVVVFLFSYRLCYDLQGSPVTGSSAQAEVTEDGEDDDASSRIGPWRRWHLLAGAGILRALRGRRATP